MIQNVEKKKEELLESEFNCTSKLKKCDSLKQKFDKNVESLR